MIDAHFAVTADFASHGTADVHLRWLIPGLGKRETAPCRTKLDVRQPQQV